MKQLENPTTILLDNAVDLMFEIYLLRGDCSSAAEAMVSRAGADAAALEECAKLDDTLAKVYRALQHTVRTIQQARRVGRNRRM